MRANLVIVDTPSDLPPALAPDAAARAVAGLAAGALAGPAPSAMVANWPEAGPAEAALLSRFYERYVAGESPALALAGAQRDMAAVKLEQTLLHQAGSTDPLADASRFAHPHYWATFALWGEP